MILQDLEDVVKKAINGIVVFSFGSNVHSDDIGEEKIQAIINTFRSFPDYTFFWKFEPKNVKNVPSNVYVRGWLPQLDLLAHKNTILFITHGGTLGLQEAVWYGVPILGIPIFGDQFMNLISLERKGAAKILQIENLRVKTFKKAIKDVVGLVK